MRLYQLLGVLIFLTAGFATARAAEEAVVTTEGKINVRGKPSLIGEVITQLENGEKVTILERITTSASNPVDPTNWAKIKLPPNTPVWVFSPFVKDGVVSVSRLNVRAGRGERFSVIGRLNRGEEVKPIRTVEEWMEIEQPADAFAFVDATLLQVGGRPSFAPAGTTPAPEVAATQPSATPAVTAPVEVTNPTTIEVPTNLTTVATSPTTSSPTNEISTPVPGTNSTAEVPQPVSNIPEVATTAPATDAPEEPARKGTTETALPVPEPVPSDRDLTASSTAPPTNGVAVSTSPLPQSLPEIAPPIEKRAEPLPKRVVRREGIVRATTSIQAPTWYELEHVETKKRINYLFSDGMDINLKDYRGKKVVVTGEEAIDSRWPNTPILDMQTLDVLP